jgi:hypothetical protein
MVTREQYLEALEIVKSFEAQEKKALEDGLSKKKELQRKREDECQDHYFLDDGKYTSTKTCTFCGKKI